MYQEWFLMQKRKAPHFRKEMIPGMGHDSRPDLAVEWFINAIEAALAQPEASDLMKR